MNPSSLPCSNCSIGTIEWLCLVKQDGGRSRVTGTAHDKTPSHDGGSMWFLLTIEKSHESETGRGN
jgi:hypothetical protein